MYFVLVTSVFLTVFIVQLYIYKSEIYFSAV